MMAGCAHEGGHRRGECVEIGSRRMRRCHWSATSSTLLIATLALPAACMAFAPPHAAQARPSFGGALLRNQRAAKGATFAPSTGLRRGGTGGGLRKSCMMLDPDLSHMIFGGIAGSVSSVMLLPMDAAKTAEQLSVDEKKEENVEGEAGVAPGTKIIKHWSSIMAKDGIQGLFKGFVPALAGGAPEAAIQFAVQDWATFVLTAVFVTTATSAYTDPTATATMVQTVSLAADSSLAFEAVSTIPGSLADTAVSMDSVGMQEIGSAFARENAGTTLLANAGVTALCPRWGIHAIAGAFAGILQIVATNPMEVLKQRAILDKGVQSKDIVADSLHELHQLGVPGLFKGYSATWLRDIPFGALYFGMAAALYEPLHSAMGGGMLADSVATSVSGLAAGVFASSITTPADVIKTRIQCGDLEDDSIEAVAKSIARQEGFGGFYKGVGARVMKIAPAMMINICVYQALKVMLQPVLGA